MPISVVICDDHPVYARGFARLLETECPDIEVVGVASGAEEAEKLGRELLPEIVLMDIRMPGTDDIEATRRIRSESPTTKVVMLTMSDESTDLYGALRAGATGYIVKDKDVQEIADAVRSVNRGHFVIPADFASRFVQDLDATDSSALSDTERGILAAIARGETNREIAQQLHMSERTVKRRVEDIYSKLHLADRLAAAIYAVQSGLRSQGGAGTMRATNLARQRHQFGPPGLWRVAILS